MDGFRNCRRAILKPLVTNFLNRNHFCIYLVWVSVTKSFRSATFTLFSMENNSVVVLSVTAIVVIASFILYKQMSSGDSSSTVSKNEKKSDGSGSKGDAKKDTQDVSITFLTFFL